MKFVIGILLLPLCYALGKVFVMVCVSSIPMLMCLLCGAAAALLFVVKKGYIGRVYVLLHELNHALWSALTGSQVTHFFVSRDGGHVDVERHSAIAALAPYYFSIPLAVLVMVHGLLLLAGWMHEWVRYTEYVCVGFIIGWHVITSVTVIRQEQDELKSEGLFFSFSLIYMFFFFWNGLLLSVIAAHFYVADFLRLGYKETIFAVIQSGRVVGSFVQLIWRLLT